MVGVEHQAEGATYRVEVHTGVTPGCTLIAAQLDPIATIVLDLPSRDRRVQIRKGLTVHVVRTDHGARHPVW